MNPKKLIAYLRGLKSHNNKQWFDAHRTEYVELRGEFSDFLQQVIAGIGRFDPAVKFMTAKEAMYRINRDIRFSKDKTPYKTNFGAGISPGGKKGELPGYHLHINADGLIMVAGGLYMITPQQLDRVRQSIIRQPKALPAILVRPSFKKTFPGLDEEEKLKKAPRGFPPDHSQVELLKLRHYVVWVERPVTSIKGPLADYVIQISKTLYPLITYLREASA